MKKILWLLLYLQRAEESPSLPRGLFSKMQRLIQTVRLVQTVRPYSTIDHLGLAILRELMLEISDKKIKGDVVECGVYNGGSTAILASAICNDPERRLWLYNTFEGMPSPSPVDGPLAQGYAGKLRSSINAVKEILSKVGFPLERMVIRKGLFKDTFEEPLSEKVALLHIDADWYESVLDALETFYPLVSESDIVVLDDFGHWEGTRKAFYEFCKKRHVSPLLARIGYTQAFWRKGQEHNRNILGKYNYWIYR